MSVVDRSWIDEHADEAAAVVARVAWVCLAVLVAAAVLAPDSSVLPGYLMIPLLGAMTVHMWLTDIARGVDAPTSWPMPVRGRVSDVATGERVDGHTVDARSAWLDEDERVVRIALEESDLSHDAGRLERIAVLAHPFRSASSVDVVTSYDLGVGDSVEGDAQPRWTGSDVLEWRAE